jgi:predicted peroxiredoxin
MARLVVHCTHGREDAERSTLAFIAANVAASADQDVVMLLTIEGVWLATRGYADTITHEGFPPLRDVMQSFVANGGQIWACGTCTKPRGIAESDLLEGARIVTAANVVERLASGAASLDF